MATPGFSAASIGSFHTAILPVKILASTSLLTVNVVIPGRLYTNATGPNTSGRSHAGFPLQRLVAGPIWSAISGESDPAKSTWPAMNCSRPAPDPVGLYDTDLRGQYWPQTWLNTAIAFC